MSNVIEKIKNWLSKLVKDADATRPPRYYYRFNSDGDITKEEEHLGKCRKKSIEENKLIEEWFKQLQQPDLSLLKKSELVKMCKDRGIAVLKKDTKSSLIKKLQ
jgi:hypothetical protein